MIYVLEDDVNILRLVCYALQNVGLDVMGFETAKDFFEGLKKMIPSLVLLDRKLPDGDGISILRRLREEKKTEELPIIMLTAMEMERDRSAGLDGGADDYITKPFSIIELISRVRAVLRRSGRSTGDGEEYVVGNVRLNTEKHTVKVNGVDINLTFKEFELLLLLMKNREKVYGREALLEEIWGYDFDGESRTVDVHIRTLRSKLGVAGNIIETVRGVGYKVSE